MLISHIKNRLNDFSFKFISFSRSRSRSRSESVERSSSSRRQQTDKHRDKRRFDHKSGNSSSSRNRSRSKDRVRRDDREKSTHKDRSHRDSSSEIETLDLTGCVDKEDEQKLLEQEMMKRKVRIERWRAERKREEIESKKAIVLPVPNAKKWSLENESDDDDDDVKEVPIKEATVAEVTTPSTVSSPIKLPSKSNAKPVENDVMEIDDDGDDDIDPLDAYMMEVHKEVRKVSQITKPAKSAGGVMVMSGFAKKNKEVNKGEMMEQNQDGLEYSSEEEVEDIKDTAANLANKHKKELAKVDHSGMNYMPFRKNFYVEVPELAKMTSAEVDAYKVELEGIQVKGKGCPKPIKTWAHCGVSKKEMDVLKRLGFEKPTPIQCQAIPAIMSGRDIIGIAKTGSGKTIAFILPMFRHILDQPPPEDGEGPIAIILTPTRELCMQIGKDIGKFSKSLNLRAVCVYGGTGISQQIAELKRGAEVIVCTPGMY